MSAITAGVDAARVDVAGLPRWRTVLARANPVAKLGAAMAIATALLLTIDPVTAGVALLLEVLALPLTGLRLREVLWFGRFPLTAAVGAAVLTLAFGADSGEQLLGVGPFTITEGSAALAWSILLRVLAVALPGIVLLATTDPTDLGDGLSQVLHLPSRFVLAALAATRLVGVLAEEFGQLLLARRARGLDARGPLAAVRAAGAVTFSLLVIAIRRGTVLAMAMESRGFGAAVERTWARPSVFGPKDAAVVAGGVLVGVIATVAGVLAGTWRLILS